MEGLLSTGPTPSSFTIVTMLSFWMKTTCDQSVECTKCLQMVLCSAIESISKLLHVLMYSFMSSAQSWAMSGVNSDEILSGSAPVGCLNCFSGSGFTPPFVSSPSFFVLFVLLDFFFVSFFFYSYISLFRLLLHFFPPLCNQIKVFHQLTWLVRRFAIMKVWNLQMTESAQKGFVITYVPKGERFI